jgi:hypothetical protein
MLSCDWCCLKHRRIVSYLFGTNLTLSGQVESPMNREGNQHQPGCQETFIVQYLNLRKCSKILRSHPCFYIYMRLVSICFSLNIEIHKSV